jgi:hypothetical protein
VRRIALAVVLVLVVVAASAGRAAAVPRCCKPNKVGGPPSLPYTGVPLYLPALVSLGLIGTGVVLRLRTREQR